MDDERNIDDIDDDHPAIRWAFLEGYKACCGGELGDLAYNKWLAGENVGALLRWLEDD